MKNILAILFALTVLGGVVAASGCSAEADVDAPAAEETE